MADVGDARPQTSPAVGSSALAPPDARPATADNKSVQLQLEPAMVGGGLEGTTPGPKDDQSMLSTDEYNRTVGSSMSTAAPSAVAAPATPATPAPIVVAQDSHEREIEIAELETRIRRFNLELIQPTIRKATLMEHEMADLRAEVQNSSRQVQDLTQVAAKVDEQVVIVEGFREEMSKWENERRTGQAHVAETLASAKQDMDGFRYSLERKDAAIHSMQRTMDRLVGELSKLQEGSESLRQHLELRLAQTGKVLNSAKTDLEVKLIALETKHNRLSDELWGEETGLARATMNITKTNDLVMSLSEEMKRMQHDKANVTQLEGVQDDVNELIRDANCNVTVLKQTVDTMVNDVKQHFKTATNTVAAHNATMLSEVRSSYQEELDHAKALRTEVKQFMRDTQKSVDRLMGNVDTSQDQTAELVKKVSADVSELGRDRKLDNSNFQVAAQSMKSEITKVSIGSEAVAKSLVHLTDVIGIMLKSDRVASALSQQENVDRAKVALMGYRDSKGSGGRPPSSKPAKKRTPRASPSPNVEDAGDAADSGDAVISVDNRCLSCSGQAQHVLSGFKMACLQYAPGPVYFSKNLYKREELLDLRQRLLEQALEQLNQGPGGTNTDFTGSANRNNMQKELEASMKRPDQDGAAERPSSQSSNASSLLGSRAKAARGGLPAISPASSPVSEPISPPPDGARPLTAR